MRQLQERQQQVKQLQRGHQQETQLLQEQHQVRQLQIGHQQETQLQVGHQQSRQLQVGQQQARQLKRNLRSLLGWRYHYLSSIENKKQAVVGPTFLIRRSLLRNQIEKSKCVPELKHC